MIILSISPRRDNKTWMIAEEADYIINVVLKILLFTIFFFFEIISHHLLKYVLES